jgi:hypothetical protein
MMNGTRLDSAAVETVSPSGERTDRAWEAEGRYASGAPVLDRTGPSALDEVLVVEERAHLRPAQVVETKLNRLLQEASLPVSHLQMRGLLRIR